MIAIGRIPQKAPALFRRLPQNFSHTGWGYFWALAITVSHDATIDHLSKTLCGPTHRSNHGEFLWRSVWYGPSVIPHIAQDTTQQLCRPQDRNLLLIIDDPQTLKRAKKMAAVGKRHHHPKKVLRLEPISQLKDRMRWIIWRKAVKDVVEHSHEKPVIRRLKKLLAS